MDLSAVIFVALALGWAAYLIPRALKHHDESTAHRLDEKYSDRARVLKGSALNGSDRATSPGSVVEQAEAVAGLAKRPSRNLTREAARRRRRVLYALLGLTAVAGALAYFAVLASWAPMVSAGLILAFLVTARISVRRQQAARVSAVAADAGETLPAEPLDTEDTVGVDIPALQQALADEGSLWDPLPVTLPTYVEKATARRTVRAIELTNITSSGHDAADSELARSAEANKVDETPVAETESKVAGA